MKGRRKHGASDSSTTTVQPNALATKNSDPSFTIMIAGIAVSLTFFILIVIFVIWKWKGQELRKRSRFCRSVFQLFKRKDRGRKGRSKQRVDLTFPKSIYSVSKQIKVQNECRPEEKGAAGTTPSKGITSPLKEFKQSSEDDSSGKSQGPSSPTEKPFFDARISFQMIHDVKKKLLLIKIQTLRLVSGFSSFPITLSIHLLPKHPKGQTIVIENAHDMLSQKFTNTSLAFGDMTEEGVKTSTITISMSGGKSGKSSKMGRIYTPISEVDLEHNRPVLLNKRVMKVIKSQSTLKKYLFEKLGQLLIVLRFEFWSRRIKLFLRKARNLPKSDKLLREPGHYVLINVYRDDEVVSTVTTKPKQGYHPVWNEPFLFDVVSEEIDHYSIECIVMRVKATRNSIVGKVSISSVAAGQGFTHWQEILSPRSDEIEKWHDILPLFIYKTNKSPAKQVK